MIRPRTQRFLDLLDELDEDISNKRKKEVFIELEKMNVEDGNSEFPEYEFVTELVFPFCGN